jgi:Leucine-rich repeat (LRR) protein
LKGLGVIDTQVNDLSVLRGMTDLQFLSLSMTQISDISVLKELTNLTRLVLLEMPLLTSEQIAELRAALPNTEIIADY